MPNELINTPLFSDSSLVSYWRSEGNSNDAKGSNNGTDTAITYSTGNGKFGQGAGFNGSTSKIVLASTGLTGNFTVHGWIKTSTDTTIIWEDFSAPAGAQAGIYLSIGFFTAHKVAILSAKHTGGVAGVDYQKAISLTSVDDGSWHMIDATYDGSNLKIYVDATLETTVAWTSGAVYSSPTPRFGALYDDTSFFNGAIDDFALFNKSLTGAEITSLFVGPSSSVSPSVSPSLSPSASQSPSASASASSSASKSPSASQSPSSSVSRSLSPSASLSPSSSTSASASPSVPPSNYSRQASISLPTTKSDLTILYTEQEVIDVSTDDGVRVEMEGQIPTYLLHQFKVKHDNNYDTIHVEIDLQTTLEPSTSPVLLQVWNTNTNLWETIATDSESTVNTDFQITGNVASNLANYYDEIIDPVSGQPHIINEITVRVYQNNSV